MKRLLATATVVVLALAPIACNNKSPEGGTPGTSASFKLAGPTIPPTIKQGDKETVKITLDRGRDFKKTVKLEAKGTDKIKVELGKTSVKHDEPAEVNLTISPSADAPEGDHKVTVTGTPEDGGTATTLDVTVKVDKK